MAGTGTTKGRTTRSAASDTERVPASEVDVVDALAAEGESGFLVIRESEESERSFHLCKEVPGITIMRLGATGGRLVPGPEKAAAIVRFLELAVVPEEREDFLGYLEEADPIINDEELAEILQQAVEKISNNRPS